jgi:LemA protein
VPGLLPVLAGIVAAGFVLAAGWGLGSFRGLADLRNLVEESWRQLDEELGRRHDLIPDLLLSVPRDTPAVDAPAAAVALARTEAVRVAAISRRSAGTTGGWAQVPARTAAEHALSAELARLFSAAAGSPDASADQFLALRREVQETEDRIAAGRRHFNAAAADLNARATRFPPRLVAALTGIGPVQRFDPPRPLRPAAAPRDPAPPGPARLDPVPPARVDAAPLDPVPPAQVDPVPPAQVDPVPLDPAPLRRMPLEGTPADPLA